mmetsp:Transcript_9067/g.30145  ORF Transcript_9067/g.30145 Transcript_9067/m.30145 type:complete len:204 (-) Transcript_9067:276-887(-)
MRQSPLCPDDSTNEHGLSQRGAHRPSLCAWNSRSFLSGWRRYQPPFKLSWSLTAAFPSACSASRILATSEERVTGMPARKVPTPGPKSTPLPAARAAMLFITDCAFLWESLPRKYASNSPSHPSSSAARDVRCSSVSGRLNLCLLGERRGERCGERGFFRSLAGGASPALAPPRFLLLGAGEGLDGASAITAPAAAIAALSSI